MVVSDTVAGSWFDIPIGHLPLTSGYEEGTWLRSVFHSGSAFCNFIWQGQGVVFMWTGGRWLIFGERTIISNDFPVLSFKNDLFRLLKILVAALAQSLPKMDMRQPVHMIHLSHLVENSRSIKRLTEIKVWLGAKANTHSLKPSLSGRRYPIPTPTAIARGIHNVWKRSREFKRLVAIA